ncbi:hypothetical protein NFI96_010449 [Prochilodus magdalenae]|nr:hypothetical protein NFI96_010449 [Prochilodus magdalenae]
MNRHCTSSEILQSSRLYKGHTNSLTLAHTASSREAKRAHGQSIHSHFRDSGDTRRMWQGIQAITNYRTAPPACDSDASLPDALNHFYARFETQNSVAARKTTPPPDDQVLCLTAADVRKTLRRLNPRKAAGPDNIPARVLRECADQLTDVFTDIFNISLSSATVPTCLKATTIIPVPKKSSVSCLNDYRPIALTPIIMKCFERLVLRHIKTLLPPSLDPLQFAYRPNRSTDDAISTTLHLALTHLDNRNTYVRMLFIDFSSAFNTIIPQHLIGKLNLLGLNTSLSNWILDFLTGRPQRTRRDHSPLHIDGSTVEIVKSTKFLGVHLAEDLTWSLNTSTITKKAQQRLYFLRRLRKAHLPPPILTTFYRGTIESILSSCITAWFGNCTASDRKSLQRVVRTAEKIIGVSLPTITDIYTTRCIRKTTSIVDDHTHPSHTLFTLLPSGKRYRSIRALTSRLCNSFFPHAIRLLNNQSLMSGPEQRSTPSPAFCVCWGGFFWKRRIHPTVSDEKKEEQNQRLQEVVDSKVEKTKGKEKDEAEMDIINLQKAVLRLYKKMKRCRARKKAMEREVEVMRQKMEKKETDTKNLPVGEKAAGLREELEKMKERTALREQQREEEYAREKAKFDLNLPEGARVVFEKKKLHWSLVQDPKKEMENMILYVSERRIHLTVSDQKKEEQNQRLQEVVDSKVEKTKGKEKNEADMLDIIHFQKAVLRLYKKMKRCRARKEALEREVECSGRFNSPCRVEQRHHVVLPLGAPTKDPALKRTVPDHNSFLQESQQILVAQDQEGNAKFKAVVARRPRVRIRQTTEIVQFTEQKQCFFWTPTVSDEKKEEQNQRLPEVVDSKVEKTNGKEKYEADMDIINLQKAVLRLYKKMKRCRARKEALEREVEVMRQKMEKKETETRNLPVGEKAAGLREELEKMKERIALREQQREEEYAREKAKFDLNLPEGARVVFEKQITLVFNPRP